jgi:2'-hydroxyisoflavone reductase
MVERATERGHTVTLFNRGRTDPHLFPELEKLRGNRDPNIGEGLSALRGRDWDAAIDQASYVPRITNASASLLADHVGQYVYISSGAVYADQSVPNITEDAEVATIDDETTEESGPTTYGPLKALCEKAAYEAMGGRVTILRPGLITGPRDPAYFRFPWWVMRVATRDEIVGPGTPDDPVRLIDSRDLAAFVIQSLEQEITGTFNANGPEDRLGVGAMIDGLKKGCGTDPQVTWIDSKLIVERDIQMLPWVWPDPSNKGDATALFTSGRRYGRGFGTRSNAEAVAAGMTFRPVEETARDTLEWIEGESAPEEHVDIMKFLASRLNPRDIEPPLWFNASTEDRLLEAWKARHQQDR